MALGRTLLRRARFAGGLAVGLAPNSDFSVSFCFHGCMIYLVLPLVSKSRSSSSQGKAWCCLELLRQTIIDSVLF